MMHTVRFVFVSLIMTVSAFAQFTTASLAGTVLDSSGASLPGAQVTVRNVDTSLTQTVNTDSAGAFLFSRLPVGTYQLTVEKAGFTTYVQSGIQLTVNQTANQTVTMQVGQVTEKVTVEANAELVTTRSATGGQLVNQRLVVDLPLNGRGAQSLVFIAPGTVNLTGRYCGVDCHGGVYPGEQVAGVNGAGSAQVNYQMDGTDHNDTYINMNLPFPNPDALQEFNLQSSNFTAEYGNAGGGIVNIVTKSGTNDIHGTAFEFLRNGVLNARNFFAPAQDTLKRNQFGGTIGGPIVRNKLFYFGTYQGTRTTSAPGSVIQQVPTAAERAGNFSGLSTQLIDPVSKQPFPGNQIPAARLNQSAQYFLQQIPLPNGSGRNLNYVGTPSSETEDQFLIKSDYYFGKQQLTGSYFFTDYKRPPVIPTGNVLASTGSGNRVRVQNVSVNHTYMVSPTLLFVSTFGLARQRGGSLSSAPFGFPDAGVKIAAPDPPELSMSVSGNFSIGTSHIGDFDRSDFTFREVATKQAGAHELKFGGEVVRLTNHIINTFQMAGSFTFNGQLSGDAVADFLLGRASAFKQGGGEFKNLKGTKWGFFVQDNWRVSQNLTLNLGVRWDPFFPYWDREGRVVCFAPGQKSTRYPNAPVGLIYGGENHDEGCPKAGTESEWWNIAPRIGFAYRLTSDGRTAIRGGAGYYYTPPQASIYNPFANIAPFAPTYSYNDVDFTDPFGSVGIPNPFPAQYGPKTPGPEAQFTVPSDLRATFPSGYHIPQLLQWNLMIEREFIRDWLARVGYFGNKGTHFYGNGSGPDRPLNAAIYVPGNSTLANIQQRRPYQNFSNVGIVDSGNDTHYNSLQLSLEKRFSHGFSVVTNYTWAKRMDDVGWTNPFNRAFDYAVADDDVKHVFHFANVYQFPTTALRGISGRLVNGWSLNSLLTWQGGFPMSVNSGIDNSFTGGTGNGNRADYIGGQADLGNSGRSHADMIQQFFNTSVFVVNAPGTFGNSGRNILRGPRFFNTDFSVLKDTRITERTTFQFRAEFFNLFNNVNFNNPNTTRTSGNFGRITSAKDPRILQFGAKIIF